MIDLVELERNGTVWMRDALDAGTLAQLDALIGTGGAGRRLSLQSLPDTVARLGSEVAAGFRPVRCVGFSKSEDGNWAVPWHQDRVIAVRERYDCPGFDNWSQKSGIWHCEPPAEILAEMVFMRIHLDPADVENGGMEVALGSHKLGKLEAGDAERAAIEHTIEPCVAVPGDVAVHKMLTLHRSASSQSRRPRRAVRVDFAGFDLPAPLAWCDGWLRD